MLNSLNITKKLAAAFAIVVGIFIIAAAVTNMSLSSLAATQRSNTISAEVNAQADHMLSSMLEQENSIYRYASTGQAADLADYTESRETFTKLASAFRDTTQLPLQKSRIEALLAAMDALDKGAFAQTIRLAANTATRDQARERASHSLLAAPRAILASISGLEATTLAAQREKMEAAQETATRSLWAGAAVAVQLAAAIGWLLSRNLARPLSNLQHRMTEIAATDFRRDITDVDRGDEVGAMAKAVLVFRQNGIAKQAAEAAKAQADAEQAIVVETVSRHLSDLSAGDLTATITTVFPREYAALKDNFNEALGNLSNLIGSVSECATTIRTGSGEIAQASEDLARRTEGNAANLEQTAASVTQMDGRLKASATAASRTVERADQAIATVGSGRAVAEEAVQAMGRVSDSAKGIDSVIEGLDKIAFQTRVLAMNAAVEAGRAGDAGRGFAVVADLVSALAMRAEEEAKRARDQLTVTQTDIVTAVEAVEKVDGALFNISGDVSQVHELLATMAADNQAQSAAISQISAAIGTMDRATQQNAAMVEETSAAARNLTNEVDNLSNQASRFKVARGGTGRVAKAARKPDYASPASYTSPIKPLPAAAVAALVRTETDEWNAF